MTVLNIANDGYFNVLIALYRAVYTFKPMDKETLISSCSAGDDERLKNTINRWLQLGLFVEKENKIILSEDYEKPIKRNKDLTNRDICKMLRKVLFKEENNNNNFWSSSKSLSADLTRGLSFLLAQDIYDANISSHSNIQSIEQKQVTNEDYRILQNDVRWNGLRSWGIYLGFLWKGNKLIPDPTRALYEELDIIFKKVETFSSTDFIIRIAEVLPVLDGGKYRCQVEEILDQSNWKKPDREDLLSTSLSRALWRLRQRGVLKFENRSDAIESRTLQRSDGKDWLKFTHISYVGENE